MKKLVAPIFCALVSIMPASMIVTGFSRVDPADVPSNEERPAPAVTFGVRELLGNAGFEKAILEPWTSPAWIVDTVDPHSGVYCAHDVGNYYIEQRFPAMPGSIIEHVTFWSRQPDQPAAQAYDFLYDDGSFGEFINFPTPSWAQFNVTANLDRGKNLNGFRIWGYSGGGPGPDSTYVDDASIARTFDVEVAQILGLGETIPQGTRVVPSALVHNFGAIVESLFVWARIESIGQDAPFADSVWLGLRPGEQTVVAFDTWVATSPGRYRYQVTVDQPDTVWYYFYVTPMVGVNAPVAGHTAVAPVLLSSSVARSFTFRAEPGTALRVYSALGELVCSGRSDGIVTWHGLNQSGNAVRPGVYTACLGASRFRLIKAGE